MWVKAHTYGEISFNMTDGDREYRYEIRIYEDESGYSQMDITAK